MHTNISNLETTSLLIDSKLVENNIINTLNYNVPTAKTLRLALWVNSTIISEDNNFLTTSGLFLQYKTDIPEKALLSEKTFGKEIEELLSAFGFKIGKVRNKLGRGYIGINFKEK